MAALQHFVHGFERPQEPVPLQAAVGAVAVPFEDDDEDRGVAHRLPEGRGQPPDGAHAPVAPTAQIVGGLVAQDRADRQHPGSAPGVVDRRLVVREQMHRALRVEDWSRAVS
ncbi:hypothetical protein [Streptomyces sp. NPDC002690]